MAALKKRFCPTFHGSFDAAPQTEKKRKRKKIDLWEIRRVGFFGGSRRRRKIRPRPTCARSQRSAAVLFQRDAAHWKKSPTRDKRRNRTSGKNWEKTLEKGEGREAWKEGGGTAKRQLPISSHYAAKKGGASAPVRSRSESLDLFSPTVIAGDEIELTVSNNPSLALSQRRRGGNKKGPSHRPSSSSSSSDLHTQPHFSTLLFAQLSTTLYSTGMLIRSSRASECSYRGIWVPTNRQHFPPSPLIILLSMAGHARSIYLIFVTKGRRGERGHHKSGSRRGPFGAQRMGCGGGGSGAGAQQMSAKVGRLCLFGWFLRRRDGRA